MALDPRFVLCPPLQEYFVDKLDGEPLSAGIVTFYEDENRAVLKPVYQITGIDPYGEASYAVLNNPLTLTSVGTFADDNGNDIVPYLYPYADDGSVELYYITVYSAAGVPQFTREAWPNTTDTNPSNPSAINNYIPNGQFLLHNDFPPQATINVPPGTMTSAIVSYIAQGGWTFQVPAASGSTNFVSFVRVNSPSSNPDESADPRYMINVQCTDPDTGDTFKDLCIKFPDVNKFASESVENDYTFSFQGQSLTGSDLACEVRLLKSFGTGGSPSTATDTEFGTGGIVISNNPQIYNIQGLFGNNAGQNLGNNDDDYLQIALRLPNVISEIQLSDFVLTAGAVAVTGFPVTPNASFIDSSTTGWLPNPNPDGSDFYLPLMATPQGAIYDHSPVGQIIGKMTPTAVNNELLCDGSAYSPDDYSPLGVPYSRLFNVLFNNGNSLNCPIFGTGVNYVNALINSGNSAEIVLSTGLPLLQANPTDGSTSTGFTFTPVLSPGDASIGYTAKSNAAGIVTASFPMSAPLLISAHDGTGMSASGMAISSFNDSSLSQKQIYSFTVVALSASSLSNGSMVAAKCFSFGGLSSSVYTMWFNVAGETQPSQSGTTAYIEVKLDPTMLAVDVGNVIANAISKYQVNLITTVAASSVAQSSFFTFQANNVTYTPWYNKDNGGTQPLGASNPIEVDISTGNTAAQIATATQIANKSQFFAVPNLLGMFLRGAGSSTIDIDQAYRYSFMNTLPATSPGTYEVGQITDHLHGPGTIAVTGTAQVPTGTVSGTGSDVFASQNFVGNTPAPVVFGSFTGFTDTRGGSETRPINAYVNWYIKY